MREADIEQYAVDRAVEVGGEIRKVQWVGRRKAPDRVLMLPPILGAQRSRAQSDGTRLVWRPRRPEQTIWIEFKHPDTGHLFPKDAHERAQHREHERMRECGQHVYVIWTRDQVDALF